MKQNLYILLMIVGRAALAQENASHTQPTATSTVQANPVANPNAPEISFTETIHDFGVLKKGSPVTYKFVFTNTGKEPLILHDCITGCHCTTAKFSKEPVLPGRKGFIEVHYDSTMVGVIMKELLVSSNAKKPVEFLLIKGSIEDLKMNKVATTKDEEIMKSKGKKEQ